jgi:hypothetical protein
MRVDYLGQPRTFYGPVRDRKVTQPNSPSRQIHRAAPKSRSQYTGPAEALSRADEWISLFQRCLCNESSCNILGYINVPYFPLLLHADVASLWASAVAHQLVSRGTYLV